ncbi:MAG: hypothetical protein KBB11_07985 [Bacteroidales bacterium]|nr:hypothetical protein [Bacteroidales bacterium]HOY37987.1 hypothetical protein [Bacteroidales bacterium]HQP04748.1 hypothetical protein [Bacteroidales bacterium]
MRKIIFTFGFLAAITAAYAQNDSLNRSRNNSEIKTLFDSDGITSHGIYAGCSMYYTQIAGRNAFVGGIKGAWVIDHVFEVGGELNGFLSEPLPDVTLSNSYYLYSGAYGGLLFATNLFPQKAINLAIPISIGAGGVAYVGNYYYFSEDYEYYPESYYAYFYVQPGLELQFNMTQHFRLAIHGSYRYTSNIYLEYSGGTGQIIGNNNLMNGFNAGITLKIGKF